MWSELKWFLNQQKQKLFSFSLHNVALVGGVPRTPVRQKMKTMCRSLKMLNVARLNVKAQKLCPDGSPDAPGDKGIQKTAGGRTADKLENRGRTLRSSKPKGIPQVHSFLVSKAMFPLSYPQIFISFNPVPQLMNIYQTSAFLNVCYGEYKKNKIVSCFRFMIQPQRW